MVLNMKQLLNNMSKTTEQRITDIVKEYAPCTGKFTKLDEAILITELEALVLSAKLDQLKESK